MIPTSVFLLADIVPDPNESAFRLLIFGALMGLGALLTALVVGGAIFALVIGSRDKSNDY